MGPAGEFNRRWIGHQAEFFPTLWLQLFCTNLIHFFPPQMRLLLLQDGEEPLVGIQTLGLGSNVKSQERSLPDTPLLQTSSWLPTSWGGKAPPNLISYCISDPFSPSLTCPQPPRPPSVFPGLPLQGLCSDSALACLLPPTWSVFSSKYPLGLHPSLLQAITQMSRSPRGLP